MIAVAILTLLEAVATIFICKSIASSFDLKTERLAEMEKELLEQQEDLRRQRRVLKRKLEEIKNDMKNIKLTPSPSPQATVGKGKLRSWLIDKNIVDSAQYQKAEKYAEEKNMDMLSSLLTLSMITIETYQRVKKEKLPE